MHEWGGDMHILMIVFAILSTLGVWYWRLQRAKDALDIVGDAAGHLKGAYNRNQSQGSVLAGIDDPQSAAAVLMACIAAEKMPLTSQSKEFIVQELMKNAGMHPKAAEEAVEFGDWVYGEVADTNSVVRKFLPIFRNSLDFDQRKDLVSMLQRVSAMDGDVELIQTSLIKQVRQGLLEH